MDLVNSVTVPGCTHEAQEVGAVWAPGLSAASSPPAPWGEGRQGPAALHSRRGGVRAPSLKGHCLETPETVHATLLQTGKLSPGRCIEPHSGEEAAPRAGGGCVALTPRPCREVCLPGGLGCRPSQDSEAGAEGAGQGPRTYLLSFFLGLHTSLR